MPVQSFFSWPQPMGLSILTTVIITFSFMVVNSVVVDWNQHIELPSFLSWFEQQAKSKEVQLQQLTEFLTNFDGFFQFLVGMIVIAIVPAIGEEFLFRGLLQNMFHKGFGNAHVAILVDSITVWSISLPVLWCFSQNVARCAIWLFVLLVGTSFIGYVRSFCQQRLYPYYFIFE